MRTTMMRMIMLDDTITTCFETNVVTDFTPLPMA